MSSGKIFNKLLTLESVDVFVAVVSPIKQPQFRIDCVPFRHGVRHQMVCKHDVISTWVVTLNNSDVTTKVGMRTCRVAAVQFNTQAYGFGLFRERNESDSSSDEGWVKSSNLRRVRVRIAHKHLHNHHIRMCTTRHEGNHKHCHVELFEWNVYLDFLSVCVSKPGSIVFALVLNLVFLNKLTTLQK